MIFRLAALALAAAFSFAAPAFAQPPVTTAPADTPQEDPGVRRGVLPNGLRWAVMRNAAPPGLFSARLSIRTGSFDETDAQLGAAHFVEHMAFNGTRNFPEGQLERAFAASGVAFGRDQNAFTGLNETRYRLDVPQADAAEVRLGLRWLRDVADGLTFSPEAVERERGVVLAEHGRSLGPGETFVRAYREFLGPGLRGPTRLPIGTPESIRAVSPDELRRFYEAWYRPENAVVTIVGAATPEDLERLIAESFGDWRAPDAPAGVRAQRGQPDERRPLDVLVRREPLLPTTVRACLASPARLEGPDTVARRRRQVARVLWGAALQRRLGLLTQPADAPFTGAAAGLDAGDREATFACFSAVPRGDDWRRAMEAVGAEVRRMQAHGVTDVEVRRDLGSLRAQFELAVNRSVLRQTPAIADELVQTTPHPDEDPTVLQSPAEALRIFDLAAANLTAADVNAVFQDDWRGAGPLIAVTSPEPVDAQAVRASWAALEAAPAPAAYAAAAATPWSYTDFGPPGRVASREELWPGFTRLRFANGVVVNFKQVADQPDIVEVRIRFGRGQREVADRDFAAATVGTSLFASGGLGRHSQDQLSELFGSRLVGIRLGMDSRGFQLGGSTRDQDLELQLQLLAAYLSDPAFRDDRTGGIPTAVDIIYRGMRASPGSAMTVALTEAVAPNSPRVLPPREQLSRLTMADFRRLFEPALRTAPLEVTVVGDVTEARATELLARTLGALPARTAGPPAQPSTYFIRYPQRPIVARATHEGDPGRAAVGLLWPLWIAEPSRRREEWSVQLLTRMLDDAVRRRVREDLGLTYSPQAGASLPDHDDQGSLTVAVETAATDVEAVRNAVRAVTRELAAGGVTQQAMDDARTAWLTAVTNEQLSAEFWVSALNGSAQSDVNLQDQMNYRDIIRSLTVADVQAAATRWLTPEPIVAIATPQATVATVGATPASGL